MALYFIALVPDEELLTEINEIKQDISLRYGPKKALRLPPHITLQIPFNMSIEMEPVLEENLVNFSKNEVQFNVLLKDFGAFKPRVVYIDVKTPDAIIELHRRLQEMLIFTVGLEKREVVNNLHPHITLATRDVKKEVFDKIWKEFRERKFSGSFRAEELVVFRHNGKTWGVWQKFAMI